MQFGNQQQEMVNVFIGDRYIATVPKENENNVRAEFEGHPDERKVRIVSPAEETERAEQQKIALERLAKNKLQKPVFNPAIKDVTFDAEKERLKQENVEMKQRFDDLEQKFAELMKLNQGKTPLPPTPSIKKKGRPFSKK